jgi:hypothetical protein
VIRPRWPYTVVLPPWWLWFCIKEKRKEGSTVGGRKTRPALLSEETARRYIYSTRHNWRNNEKKADLKFLSLKFRVNIVKLIFCITQSMSPLQRPMVNAAVLSSENHMKHINTLCKMQSFIMLEFLIYSIYYGNQDRQSSASDRRQLTNNMIPNINAKHNHAISIIWYDTHT